MGDVASISKSLRVEGYAYPCSMCTHMWSARDQGKSSCGVDGCGGPPGGKLFPLYKGPLTTEHMTTHCFACGKESDRALVLPGTSTGQGVCKKHIHLAERVASKEDLERDFPEEDYKKIIR